MVVEDKSRAGRLYKSRVVDDEGAQGDGYGPADGYSGEAGERARHKRVDRLQKEAVERERELDSPHFEYLPVL